VRIDAHQHFWRYSETEYPWIPINSPLHRDWLPEDFAPRLKQCDLEGSIAVQARQSIEESRWLLELARDNPIIRGVVGWVDLPSPGVGQSLRELALNPKFVGVRHVAQDEPDDRFLVRPQFVDGIARLEEFNLAYDLLIYPRQLRAAIELVEKFPRQRFILDHLAKPSIARGLLSPWREEILELARFPNVSCKVSGLITEADHQSWRPENFTPYLDMVWEAFGEDRLMFGSDWPVCLLAGDYATVFNLIDKYTTKRGPSARAKIFGDNAARFYKLA
jgi:L-fuconolactonase